MDFRAFPSAQLYWENLAARGIVPVASYEAVYGWANILGLHSGTCDRSPAGPNLPTQGYMPTNYGA